MILNALKSPLSNGVVMAIGFNVCCLLLNCAVLSSLLRWSMIFKINVALVERPYPEASGNMEEQKVWLVLMFL